MWNGMGFGNWGWGGGMGLGMVLFWGALIAVIVLVVRSLGNDAAPRGGDKTPLQILKERYARGEIGKDEFEQKQRDLEA
ncbi:MAG: SHOCT domain-containing protein [Burkholderiales bacterium]